MYRLKLHRAFLLCVLLTFSLATPTPDPASANLSTAPWWICSKGEDWMKLWWPPYVTQPYKSILHRLRTTYVVPNPGTIFEFIPEGEQPQFGLPVVRTPFKLVLGMRLLTILSLSVSSLLYPFSLFVKKNK